MASRVPPTPTQAIRCRSGSTPVTLETVTDALFAPTQRRFLIVLDGWCRRTGPVARWFMDPLWHRDVPSVRPRVWTSIRPVVITPFKQPGIATISRRLILVACMALSACASITPAPRYTADPSVTTDAGSSVGSELTTRERARRRGGDDRLMRVVRTYLGIPYQWGGTTRKGMDCSALTRAVVREVYGIELPRTSKQMYRLGKPQERGALRRGDLVFFRIDDSGPGVSHVGIYVGDGEFAHASSSRGAVIDPLSSSYFEKRYAGARRILLD